MRCTKELLMEHGVDSVGMADIAKKAELSKGTLYLYFSKKEDLFKEICDEAAERFLKHFYAAMPPDMSGLDALKFCWRCYLDMFGESEDMILIFNMKYYIASEFPFNPFDADQEPDSTYIFYTLIRDMIRQGVTEGVFDPEVKEKVIARTLLSLFSYIVENVAKLPKRERKPYLLIEEIRQTFEIILRGIAREGVERSLLRLPGLSDSR